MDTTVLIVGAGPTGLALACELARFRIACRLIDQKPQPAQYSQALAVQARTLEQWERYGIAEEAVATGLKAYGAKIFSGGKMILHARLQNIASKYPFVLGLPQSTTEALLTTHLTNTGGSVEREITLLGYSDRGTHIEAQLRNAAGHTEKLTARWIVGCDGINSLVRQTASIAFKGNKVPEYFSLADVHLTGKNVPTDELNVFACNGDFIVVLPYGRGLFRLLLERHQPPEDLDAKPTLAEFQKALDTLAARDLHASDPVWLSRFYITEKHAERYRAGNAFIAGDAAHVHSPVGGQGMNTGIQDVANLAWKFDAVLHGSPDSLLDTYDAERGPIGKRLIAGSSAALGVMTTTNPAVQFLRNHLAPIAASLGAVRRKVGGIATMTTLRYEKSQAVNDHGGGSKVHAGEYAPDAPVMNQHGATSTVHELIREPHSHILGSAADAPWMLTDGEANPYQGREALVYVIRPDGYVGFRGPATNQPALDAYLKFTCPHLT